MIYFRPIAGVTSLFTVMLSRRIFGLSYSSIDMPRDKRRGPNAEPSFDPPELVENARPRSTPNNKNIKIITKINEKIM